MVIRTSRALEKGKHPFLQSGEILIIVEVQLDCARATHKVAPPEQLSRTSTIMRLEHHLINIAPAPVLTGLERLDNGMLGGMKMLRGMRILGRITAANMTTD
jgi:hypothetical protein